MTLGTFLLVALIGLLSGAIGGLLILARDEKTVQQLQAAVMAQREALDGLTEAVRDIIEGCTLEQNKVNELYERIDSAEQAILYIVDAA